MIVYVTSMDAMPANCMDCKMACTYPTSARDNTRVLKPYVTKRHPKCPLREIKKDEEVFIHAISK